MKIRFCSLRLVAGAVISCFLMAALPGAVIPAYAKDAVYQSYDCTVSIKGDTLKVSGGRIMEDYINIPFWSWDTDITQVIVDSGIQYIGSKAFIAMPSLKKVTLADTVTTISDYAFQNDPIEEIDLPEGIELIGDSVFYESKFSSITIPANVKAIGSNAFFGNDNLKTVIMKGDTPPVLYNGVFYIPDPKTGDSIIMPDLKIIVPHGKGEVYKINMIEYADYIVEEGESDNPDSPTLVVTPKSISLNRKSCNIEKGTTYALKATVKPANAADKAVTWKSSNPGIATVDKNGKVKGIKKGSARITATTKIGKKTATCNVTVTEPVRSIKFVKKTYVVKKGSTVTLAYTIKPKNVAAKNITFKSSNKKIATVDKNGKVKGIKKGAVKVTVATRDGKKKATCKVTVK